jgi:hypothetical protein
LNSFLALAFEIDAPSPSAAVLWYYFEDLVSPRAEDLLPHLTD